MTIQLLQRAKFALLYSKQPVIDEDRDGPFVGTTNVETPLAHPAILEIHGLRLTSAWPSSASDAAKINERVDAVMSLERLQEIIS